jgi:exodeoxyribonuclease V alpha subunit
MEKEAKQKNDNINEFYKLLSSMKAVSPIYEKIMKHLVKSLAPELSDDAQKVLYIYFSLLEDGNTRIPLNAEKLYEKWMIKWNGLLIQENSLISNEKSDCFKKIIKAGVNDLLNDNYSNIIGENKLFIINDNYLYANKYYEAKIIIEEKFKALFQKNKKSSSGKIITNQDIQAITKSSDFELNSKQLEAVNRGICENLIVTGGPGTGKTTVVLFILWFLLLNNKDYCNYNIYLSAPSGKASDRVKESLVDNLEKIYPQNKEETDIRDKFKSLDSYTLHRLLRYNPGSGRFIYNSDNQFEEKSIFVIDEASMIDISMFANLLQAIPDTARIFILGDVDQLPSVDAGAVLGDLLNSAKDNVVKLNESRRFTADSYIGKLKEAIYKVKVNLESNLNNDYLKNIKFELFDSDKSYWSFIKENKHIDNTFISLIEESDTDDKDCYIKYKTNFENLLVNWINEFYYDNNEFICSIAEKVNPLIEKIDEKQNELRKTLWNMSLHSKILCAEKQSMTGLDSVNRFVQNYIKRKYIENFSEKSADDKLNIKYYSKYFPGQLIIITRNQEMYNLYNGDTGVIVFSEGRPYFMIKKNDYLFYPLSVLPVDAYETAFAITVHKSQGSEYDHILMFIPIRKGHRVLTNQIIYTGVTRAKKSVTIVGKRDAFEYACSNVIERDTGISLE